MVDIFKLIAGSLPLLGDYNHARDIRIDCILLHFQLKSWRGDFEKKTEKFEKN